MPADVPIAIIGSAYRAPGVGRKGLWEFLAEARSAWSKVPADRFQQSAFHHMEKPGFFSSAGAHFLPDDIYAFDPAFFNITADEARAMDPQHRILMECALEACESAGLSLATIANTQTGVFAALAQPEYGYQAVEDLPTSNKFTATGVASTMFANRLSYWFNLKGPSITVDAACASGSYALHLACQSIRAGECSSTFVGGCSLIVSPATWVLLDTLGALSPAGKCFSYDSKASGFGRGEGAGCIILKRLSDALADGDPIRAVIRNTAAGHSGKTDGISLPSRTAQADLLWKVHADVGLLPDDTVLVEGHGTGTAVGDPIEASAIASVLGKDRTPANPVFLGSLKSNFGHLEGASGILATIKAMMMVENGQILPTAWFEELNRAIEEKEKLCVVKTVTAWPSDGRPRRICVSNFGMLNVTVPFHFVPVKLADASLSSAGFGGSNAVALLEQSPVAYRPGASRTSALVQINGQLSNGCNGMTNGHSKVHMDGHRCDAIKACRIYAFSARSDISLSTYLSTFSSWLEENNETSEFLHDLAFTLGSRRSHFPYRFAAVADSVSSLKQQISSFSKSIRSRQPNVAFVFTGQGAQYAGMAAELHCYKHFHDTISEAEDHLRRLGAIWSLKDELCRPERDSRISEAEISQPACTAVQIALVRQLEHWGIRPSIVAGHSSGEIGSAYAAGVLSLGAAIAVAYYRGRAAGQIVDDNTLRGAMLAVGISVGQAEALIQQHQGSGYATVAAINSPDSVTISGDEDAIVAIHRTAEAQGAFVRRLKVSVAYHSRHMKSVASTYLAAISPWCKDCKDKGTSNVKYISSVTGRAEVAEALGPLYWVENLLQPVRFMDAVDALVSVEGTVPTVILEIGPHSALKTAIQQTLENRRSQLEKVQVSNLTYLPTLLRGMSADQALLNLAAKMYSLGTTLSFAEINDRFGATPGQVLTHLPAYEWNKSVRYIQQHRITQQKQQPGYAYHPLLGWKSPYSEARDHSFRQIFSLDEMPWIRDHNIAKTTTFPMAGYICMAAAALKALRSSWCAVIVRDFHAKRGLSIDEEERVELITKLTPTAIGTEGFSLTSWSFEIASWTQTRGWTTHCFGIVEPDASEDITHSPTLSRRSALAFSPSLRVRDAAKEYALLAKNGMRYEGIFRTMDKLSTAPGLTVMETQARRPHSSFTDTTAIDPPMLDAFLHCAAITVEVVGEENIRHTYMPVSFSRLRLPAALPASNDHRFTTIMELNSRDEKTGDFRTRLSIFRNDNQDGRLHPVVEWESVLFKAVSRHETVASTLGPVPNSYYIKHVPSIKFWDSAQMQRRISVEPASEEEKQIAHKSDQLARYFMSRALNDLVGEDLTAAHPSHLVKCVDWIRRTVAGQAVASDGEAKILIEVLSGSGAQGEMLCLVGQRLIELLRDELQPLEIMLRDGLLSRNYEEDRCVRRANRMLGKYVRHLVEANPFLRVLEIGAGTGSSTAAIFEALSEDAGPKDYPHIDYTYTDISSGFFEGGRAKLASWTEQMMFKKLDITRDPVNEQGFVAESYDLIVAGNVLHATPSMQETLQHTRSLLRPGGTLALVEFTANMPFHLPWSTLPGWWMAADDYRSDDGPLLSEASWDRALRESGFMGAEMVAEVNVDIGGLPMALISSTRVDVASASTNTVKTSQRVIVWGEFTDDTTTDFAETLTRELCQHYGYECVVQKLQESVQCDNETLNRQDWSIVIDDSTRSILDNITQARYQQIHDILSNSGGLLWVIPCQHAPESAIASGMLRALRQEDLSRSFLSFEGVPLDQDGVTKIAQLLPELDVSTASQQRDQEFVLNAVTKDIEVPRLRMLKDVETPFLCDAGVPPRLEQGIWEAAGADAMEMTIDAAGSPDSIFFRRSDILAKPLERNEVIVRVEAAGVNFRDLLLILGTLPWMAPGFEGAGVITHVGEDVGNVAFGDHVFFIAGAAAFATHVRISSSWACKIPSGTFSSVEAASMPLAYSTAFLSLRRTANLRKGESVLIHAASGAVGQACIAVAQADGAEVFVTADTQEKRDFVHKSLGVPATHIFSSQTPDFRDGILSATEGRGVDIIVNSLSGPLLRETWLLIADFGRFVELGHKDFLENSHLAMKPFDRNVTFSGIDLQNYFARRPETVAECFAQMIQGLASGFVQPIRPVHEIQVSDIAAALRKLQSGFDMGKLVVTMGQHDLVLAEKVSPLGGPSIRLLKTDATYLITGGTGGIGRSLARWMFAQGAGNVVLLGRSGSSRPEVAQLIEEYSNQSGKSLRAVTCDVGSQSDVQAALDSMRDLPKVRGVVHGALYLRDSLFANATFEDWEKITDPKIRAAWNLHHLCPDLDFFVSLGSIAGVTGHTGQSIYAGTSTFLDAFTDHRIQRGLPASNISLPIVLDVGYAAERGIDKELGGSAGVTLTEAQLHTTVKAAIIGASSGMLVDGKGMVFALSEVVLQRPSLDVPLSMAALHPRHKSSPSSKETTGATSVELSRVRDLPTLLDALMHKVASMTLMEREEVEADQPLANYGLDSLVLVELRNWIRKETGVDISLARIVSAENLQALAETMLA